jgi:hypothetical protein
LDLKGFLCRGVRDRELGAGLTLTLLHGRPPARQRRDIIRDPRLRTEVLLSQMCMNEAAQ